MNGQDIIRGPHGHFQPGVSANPGGLPKIVKVLREQLAEGSPEAVKRILELVGSQDERVALAAAQTVLDRVMGRVPTAATEGEEQSAVLTAFLQVFQRHKDKAG